MQQVCNIKIVIRVDCYYFTLGYSIPKTKFWYFWEFFVTFLLQTQSLLQMYFLLQIWCISIAIFLLKCFFTGRPAERLLAPQGPFTSKCSVCNSTFASKGNLKRHTVYVHERKKQYTSSLCNHIYSREGSLKKHMQSVHEKKKVHLCPIYECNYSSKEILKEHIESVHDKKKPYECRVCDYGCSKIANLKKHIESVHDKRKPYKCAVCEHYFSQKGTLKKHMKLIHMN